MYVIKLKRSNHSMSVKHITRNVTLKHVGRRGPEGNPATNLVRSVQGRTGDVVITKTDVGLGNVDNTSDTDKPVSDLTQDALDAKVESVVAGTNITVDNTDPLNPIVSSSGGGAVDSVNGQTGVVVLDKSDVGLGNVDNTSDANKPISTAVQSSLDNKVPTSRTINGYPLTSDVDLSYSDLSGLPLIQQLVYNVKDYGATGDGTSDDTDAIQDTIDAASTDGKMVYFPKGTYIVDPTVGLDLYDKSVLRGDGWMSVIKIKSGINTLNNLLKAESVDDIMVFDLALDGNRSTLSGDDSLSANYGLYMADVNNANVQNVYAHSFNGVGIHAYGTTGVIAQCLSNDNIYHAYELEQTDGLRLLGNAGYDNLRHGVFVSPGEVGGTGAKNNVICGNTFQRNGQYGVAFGIDAAGISIGLTKDNIVANNIITDNGDYGVSIYRVNDVSVYGNLIANNGKIGIYLYRAERNQIVGNRLHNNSQDTNGAYDEILIEGAGDGQASQHNIITDNYILIDGTNKSNYGIREATSGDGPNVIKNNYIPLAGVSGRILVQHPNTSYEVVSDIPEGNTMSLRTFDDGVSIAPNATLPGSTMGLDAPFGTAALRFFNDNSGGNLQFVAPNGNLDMYLGGNNTFSVTDSYATLHGYPLKEVEDPTDPQDAATKAYTDLGYRPSGTDVAVADGGTGASTASGARTNLGLGTIAVLAAPSGTVVGTSDTQTLSNKRVSPRAGSTASSATPSIDTNSFDYFAITALATNITSMTTNLTGTPTTAQKLWIAITDNGTARSITWGSSFEASSVALPTTTVISTRIDVGFIWNNITSKWRCVAIV